MKTFKSINKEKKTRSKKKHQKRKHDKQKTYNELLVIKIQLKAYTVHFDTVVQQRKLPKLMCAQKTGQGDK